MKKIVEISFVEGEGEDKLEYQGSVTLKRLNFSEHNALEEEATDIKVFAGVPQIKVSSSKMKELAILKGIVSMDLKKITYVMDKVQGKLIPAVTPCQITLEEIKNLPQDIGDQLFLEFMEINSVTDKKKEG